MLIFVAIPTRGTVRDGALTPEFLKFLANLHAFNPEHTFISPMVQDYQLLQYMNTAPDWASWGKHCRTIIERCDQVWVLQFDGWDSSVGVRGEIDHATLHNKPITYIKVPK